MAFTEKRGGGRYRVRYRGPDGKEGSRTFRKRTDADAYRATVVADLVRRDWVDPRLGRITFERFVDEHWRPTVVHLRPSTRARYEGILRNQLFPHFGEMPLDSITRSEVKAFVAGLLADDELAPASVRKVGKVLTVILAAAEEDGRIPESPCQGLKLPVEPSREMRFLGHEEVVDLAEAMPEHFRALVLSAAYLGLRWGELAGLKVERLNLLQRKLHVVEQLTEVAGELRLGPVKTRGSERTLTVPRFLVPVLEDQLAREEVRATGFVFPSPEGGHLRRSNFRRRAWRTAIRATGLEGLRFHDLRHTAVALSIQAGAHPKSIQARMGHSSIKVTLDRYGHLYDDQDEALADALDAGFRASRGTSVDLGDEAERSV